MGRIYNMKKALARYGQFAATNKIARAFVQNMLNEGKSTSESLRIMRKHFSKEYYLWKTKKGYPKTDTDDRFKGLPAEAKHGVS